MKTFFFSVLGITPENAKKSPKKLKKGFFNRKSML